MSNNRPEASTLYVKEYNVKFGGKTHKLRMDLNAFAAMEEAGYEYLDIVKIATKISFKGIGTLLWAGTQHEGHDLTENDIRRMVDLKAFSDCQATVQTAILGALPTEDDDNSKKQDPGKTTESLK